LIAVDIQEAITTPPPPPPPEECDQLPPPPPPPPPTTSTWTRQLAHGVMNVPSLVNLVGYNELRGGIGGGKGIGGNGGIGGVTERIRELTTLAVTFLSDKPPTAMTGALTLTSNSVPGSDWLAAQYQAASASTSNTKPGRLTRRRPAPSAVDVQAAWPSTMEMEPLTFSSAPMP